MSNYDLGEFTFGSGDERVQQQEPRFKGKKGEKYRLSFAWLPGVEEGTMDFSGTPRFKGGKVHFINKVGYVFHLGPEFAKFTGKKPRSRVATIVVKWRTDRKGKIDKTRLESQDFGSEPGDYEVLYWAFGDDKYEIVKDQADEWPIQKHDLMVSCTDSQYQKMTFKPAQGNVLRIVQKKHPNLFKRIVAEVADLVPNLMSEVGRKMTLAEIREKLNDQGEGQVQPIASSVESEDVDDLVDSYLEE